MAEEPLALAREAYREVLDATKHQDDKIGRFLTAISFLTAAALALGTQEGVVGTRFDVLGSRLPLLSVAIGVFLSASIISALWFVLSLSTQLTVPEPSGGLTSESRLFFLVIASKADGAAWRRMWPPSSDPNATEARGLRESLYEDYIREARNLALRADLKYRRYVHGTALFTFGLAALAISVPLALVALSGSGPGPNERLVSAQTWDRVLALATGTLAAVVVLSYTTLQFQRSRRFGHKGIDNRHAELLRRLLLRRLFALPIVVFLQGAVRDYHVGSLGQLHAGLIALSLFYLVWIDLQVIEIIDEHGPSRDSSAPIRLFLALAIASAIGASFGLLYGIGWIPLLSMILTVAATQLPGVWPHVNPRQ